MRKHLYLTTIFLFVLFLSSCVGIVDNDQVAKDTLEKLKEKYNEEFSVVSVSNDTQGHRKGAIMPTGNVFTIELNSKPHAPGESPTWFLAHAAYDSNKQFVYYGDTYEQRLIGDRVEKDFVNVLKSGYQGHIACNLFFEIDDDPALSSGSGTVYFFKAYPDSEKETTEHLRKCFQGLSKKPGSIDLFVYYWDENYLKENPVDSMRFAFAYEYREGYFETGKTPARRYRLQLGKNELDHIDTLNLYRYMKDF